MNGRTLRNKRLTQMTQRSAEILLFIVIALRSSGMLFSKIAMRGLGIYTILAYRFLIAFLLLALLFRRQLVRTNRNELTGGLLIGISFFFTMAFEMHGLEYAPSSTVSFLENTAIIIVPFAEALLLRRRPAKAAVISGLTALAGVGLLTLKGNGFSLSIGEAYALLAALAYTASIITTDRFSRRGNPVTIGIIQLGTIGLLGLTMACITETPGLPRTPAQLGAVLFLAMVCSGVGFTLQPVAQRHTTAERTGMFCAFNPLITSVLGVVFLGERFGANKLAGAACILLSLVLASVLDRNKEKHNSANEFVSKAKA